MSLTEGLLIVIVLILTVIVLSGRMSHSAPVPTTKTWDCVNRDNGEVTSVKMQYSKPGANPEKDALSENAEHFASCRNPAEDTARALDCMCDGDSKFEYAVNEFGSPGLSYQDFVRGQSIDPSVISAHSEFVADRMKLRGDNVLGKAWSADSAEASDTIPWQGLRRPQAVPICNPTQLPEVNLEAYNLKPKFTWDSSTGSVGM